MISCQLPASAFRMLEVTAHPVKRIYRHHKRADQLRVLLSNARAPPLLWSLWLVFAGKTKTDQPCKFRGVIPRIPTFFLAVCNIPFVWHLSFLAKQHGIQKGVRLKCLFVVEILGNPILDKPCLVFGVTANHPLPLNRQEATSLFRGKDRPHFCI